QVSLSWAASVGATGYQVKRSLVNGGPYSTVGCATGTSFVDSGLGNGTTYYYVVSATYTGGPHAGGASANSSQARATPQAPAPPPPTGVTATPGNTQVALSWTASTGTTSYNVKRATVSGGPYTTVTSTSATGYTDPGLSNGTTYYYVITAVNASGESGNSSQVNATPQAIAPAPPTGLIASPNKPGRLTLRWTQSATPGVTQSNIYRRTSTGSYPATPTLTIGATTMYQDNGV